MRSEVVCGLFHRPYLTKLNPAQRRRVWHKRVKLIRPQLRRRVDSGARNFLLGLKSILTTLGKGVYLLEAAKSRLERGLVNVLTALAKPTRVAPCERRFRHARGGAPLSALHPVAMWNRGAIQKRATHIPDERSATGFLCAANRITGSM